MSAVPGPHAQRYAPSWSLLADGSGNHLGILVSSDVPPDSVAPALNRRRNLAGCQKGCSRGLLNPGVQQLPLNDEYSNSWGREGFEFAEFS